MEPAATRGEGASGALFGEPAEVARAWRVVDPLCATTDAGISAVPTTIAAESTRPRRAIASSNAPYEPITEKVTFRDTDLRETKSVTVMPRR